jgi:hypothetical protein
LDRLRKALIYAWRKAPMNLRRPIVRTRDAIWLRRAYHRLSHTPDQHQESPQSIVLIGHLSAQSGLARAAELQAQVLTRAGYSVDALDFIDSTDEIQSPGEDGRRPPKRPSATLVIANPPYAVRALASATLAGRVGGLKIASWAWELETAPASWRRAADEFDVLCAPSVFSANAIERTVQRPVLVVPHACSVSSPPPLDDQRRSSLRRKAGVTEGAIVFAFAFCMRSGFERKNPLAAVRAVLDASSPQAVLIIRVNNRQAYPKGWFALKEAARKSEGRVILLTPAEISIEDFYDVCDVYLSLHRSEGFGLTLAEAMMRNKLVIATDWSGNRDFMNEANSALVPAHLVPAVDPQRIYTQTNARWADPVIAAATAHIERAVVDEGWRTMMGYRAGVHVARHLTSAGPLLQEIGGDEVIHVSAPTKIAV